jgi:hypothetical protein
VAEFTSNIAGATNVVADTLSRPPGYMAAKDPTPVATCVKVPSAWSQVAALRGDKQNSSPPSLSGFLYRMQTFYTEDLFSAKSPIVACRDLNPGPTRYEYLISHTVVY